MVVTVVCKDEGWGRRIKNKERRAIFKLKCKIDTRRNRYELLMTKMGRIGAVLYLRKWFPVHVQLLLRVPLGYYRLSGLTCFVLAALKK